jgi:preprotein translocase subunit SecE
MNDKTENKTGVAPLDIAKLTLGILIAVGSAVAFYWFEDRWPMYARVLTVLAGVGIGAAIAAISGPGIQFRGFLKEAQFEVRKVVWPTRQETWQTTLIVGIAVLIIGVMIWIIDMILAWIVRLMMG